MIRRITNWIRKKEKIREETLDFQEVESLFKKLDRDMDIVSLTGPRPRLKPADVLDDVLAQLIPFGKYYFEARHEIFLDRQNQKETHYFDLSTGLVAENGSRNFPFYTTTLTYDVNQI